MGGGTHGLLSSNGMSHSPSQFDKRDSTCHQDQQESGRQAATHDSMLLDKRL